ncbi:hypothetical protein K8352_12550 [Flavobacteriaceae bacterium F89]|uniref:Uncharacterized protein n=1 Tax=Cerina litoralis TaxID=2874477 RepID=A0AAE3JTJ9_9FLAO|nr:hypothetical protein [Cerina litoralis]MCG2461582.1 hypothetical protein [Cerina litoralis]
MSRCLIFSFTLIYLSFVYVQAQPMVTKETKVLLVMDPVTEDFRFMELFDDRNNVETLGVKYPGHGIYIGLLQGGYELHDERIRPEGNAVITIYTDQQLIAGNLDFPEKNYPIGRDFKMQGNSVRVVSNKKGELILKMK